MKVKVNNLSFLCCSLWGAVNVVIFNTIVFLITMSHLRAVLSDPGVVPLPSASMDFSDLHSSQPPKNTTVSISVSLLHLLVKIYASSSTFITVKQ